ncbi:RNA 2',3'-cyclic phosphodiesterase [Neiella marina]|uniref:RNA 2',3'-cyclic phosphodiesterase n=1 Tax=Neiella marina TaxID=508461 RepID=UPI000B3D1556|nr:RNA 2',3'-cyclic phosphodiesterase [Neiella marina]
MFRRLFVAVSVPKSVQQRISRWQLQYAPIGSRPIAAENLHLTLAFLGNCDDDSEQRLCQRLNDISASGWQQTLDTTGWFAKPAIGYLAPTKASNHLLTLHEQVKRCAEKEAMVLPCHQFVPHVSVFRHHQYGQTWRPPLTPLSWQVTDFRLYQSHQGQYHQRQQWQLHSIQS